MSSPWTPPAPGQDEPTGVQEGYGAPGPGYSAPAPAPGPGYSAPGPGYSAPAPGPGYSAPGPGYGAPGPGYGAPAPAPAPGPGYGAPAPAPAPAPGPGYGAPGASGYSQTGAWGWAPKPGIIPLRPLSISDLLSGSFAALRMNPKVLFGFTLIVLTIVGVLSSLVSIFPMYSLMSASEYGGDPQASPDDIASSVSMAFVSTFVGYAILLICSILAVALLNGILSTTVAQMVIGKKITFRQAWALAKPRMMPVLGAVVLTFLGVGIPVILWIVGIVVLLLASGSSNAAYSAAGLMLLALFPMALVSYAVQVRLLYAPMCAVLEHAGPVESIKRSWSLTSGAFWTTLGRLMLISILVGFIAGMITMVISTVVVGIVFAVFSAGSLDPTKMVGLLMTISVLTSILQMASYALVFPIMSAFQTLMFVDQKIRTENFAFALAQAARS